MSGKKLPRRGYHHGDLANALVKAATQMARQGGPEAIVLREAARQVGVSATSSYRYFPSRADLIHAVSEVALTELAESMLRELAAETPSPEPVVNSYASLRALGAGYLRFAVAEPGLFRTAFRAGPTGGEPADRPLDLSSSQAYRMLGEALDVLVSCGQVPAARRPMLELAVWSAVHGLGELLINGPLSRMPHEMRQPVIDQLFDLLEFGLQPNAIG
jgi:AcrR family transcriptional regulator